MKKNLFNEMIGVLCITFNRELSEGLVSAYSMALSEHEEKDLIRAGAELIKGQFFPRPYDFIQLLSPTKISIKDRADDAWNTIVAKSCGTAGMVIEDPLTFKAMNGVCDQYMIARSNEFQLNNYQKRFTASYRVLAEAEEDQAKRDRLDGTAARRIEG